MTFGEVRQAFRWEQALALLDVALLDESGKQVPAGTPGVIAVRRNPWILSSGYWNSEAEWKARGQDDWFVTGDTAYEDQDGYIWFLARHDDVIVTAGTNVGPFEVESVLVSHPAVAEAAVVGKPDPRRGQALKAYVVLRAGEVEGAALVETLQKLVRERVGKHAWPREVEFVTSLPRTESGKIQRALLRRRAAEEAPDESRREKP